MSRSRTSLLLMALVVCVTASACGGSQQGGGDSGGEAVDAAARSNGAPGSPGGSPQGPSGGAAGAPTNRKSDAVAAGAPFKMPAFQQRTVGNIDELEEDIRAAIKDGCPNDELCVPTVRQPLALFEGQAYHPSCFLGTDPDTSVPDTNGETELDPQKTKVLTIYQGTDESKERCLRQDGSGGTDSTDATESTDTSGQSTDTSDSTDTTESTDTTQPDDSQSQPPSSS
jgi:hypothetical protein